MEEPQLRKLMVLGLKGDAVAYRSLLSALSSGLRSYYRARLVRAGRSPDNAEDLVQEALLAIHNRRDTYDPTKPFSAWAYAIARYKLFDYLRQSNAAARDIPFDDVSEMLFIETDETSEGRLDILNLLEKLPDKFRLAVQYVKIEGRSIAEAAHLCGVTEPALKSNVHRGLKRLASLVSERAAE